MSPLSATLRYISLAFTIIAVAGCATRAPFHTENTKGKVLFVREIPRGAPMPAPQTIYIPIRSIVMPITITTMQQTPGSFIYVIETSDKTVLVTQSTTSFMIGECVELWHAPWAPGPSSEYNFVAGTLERNEKCQ